VARKQSEVKAQSWRVALQAITGPWTYANLLSWVKLIALILVIRWAWFEPYKIPSGSMEPTLIGKPGFLQGDRVFVNKYYYGLRVPFMNKRIFEYKKPDRWDIVVFKAAHENPEHTTLIKRIVGLPGEKVLIKDGHIWIDGEPVIPPGDLADDLYYTRYVGGIGQYLVDLATGSRPFPSLNPENENARIFMKDIDSLRTKLAQHGPNDLDMNVFREWLTEFNSISFVIAEQWFGRSQRVEVPAFRYGIIDEPQFAEIPEGHYFLLGDNSTNSVDGRFFGWVPGEHLVGRTFCVWWPMAHWQDFTGFSATWWGQLLLWGLPLGLLALGFVTHSIGQIIRLPNNSEISGLLAGDRVLIDCRAYGIRAPFVSNRITRGRAPETGECVLYRAEEGGHYLGIVRGVPGSPVPNTKKETVPEGSILLERDQDEGGTLTTVVPTQAVVGRVNSVLLPLSRRRRLAVRNE
jgi:signal peptidase I